MGMTIEEKFKTLQDEYTHLMGKYQMMQANYETQLKADMVTMIDKIEAEIKKEVDTSSRLHGISEIGLRKALKIINKHKTETGDKEDLDG